MRPADSSDAIDVSAVDGLDTIEPGRALGDLAVVLLAGALAGLRDQLAADGYHGAAELVADLVDIADDYLMRLSPEGPRLV